MKDASNICFGVQNVINLDDIKRTKFLLTFATVLRKILRRTIESHFFFLNLEQSNASRADMCVSGISNNFTLLVSYIYQAGPIQLQSHFLFGTNIKYLCLH